MHPWFREHLSPDTAENDRQPDVQIDKARDQVGEEKIQRSQPKNRADVGGINDEGVTRDREYGGNGINRKNQVHGFDHNQNKREGSEHPPAADQGDKLRSVIIGGDMNQASNGAQDESLLEVYRLRFSAELPNAGDQKEGAEKLENKVEA